jgi:hypothetical protein
MSSRPLLASVALSTVTFGPIDQLGCFRASDGDACCSFSTGQSRNAPPLAVRTMRLTPALGWPSTHWKTALCSLSTGRIRVPARRAASMTNLPARTRISFEARARSLPGGEGGHGGLEPGGPDDGDEDDVRLGQRRELGEARGPLEEPRAHRERPGLLRLGVRRRVVDRGVPDRELAGDLGQLAPVGARRDADQLQPVLLGGDDAERALPDGPRRPQEDDPPAGAERRGGCGGFRHSGGALRRSCWSRKYPTGAARIRLSLRSKMPPIPGTPPPESLRAALRLITDSMRSDTMATAATGAASQGRVDGAKEAGRTPRPSHATRAPTPIDVTTPPAAPSHVFFGLVTGAMGWRPMASPVRSAPTSQNLAAATTQRQRTRRPAGGMPSPGDRRHDPDEVLQEERDVDQAEERRGKRLDALLGGALKRILTEKTTAASATRGWEGIPYLASVQGASVMSPPKRRPSPEKGALPAAAISL